MQKEIMLTEYFNKVHCKDFGKLILTQGEQPSLVIEADQELLAELVTEVRGEVLSLGLDQDWFGRIGKVFSSLFNSSDYQVTYHLTVPDLDQINISGKIDLECGSFLTDTLSLKITGLGDLDFTHLDCNSLDVVISGRGEFAAAGRADQQTVRISGSGEYEAPNLASHIMHMTISGQGNANIRVDEHLDITISGMGQVNYYGHPTLRQVISGLGKSKRVASQKG